MRVLLVSTYELGHQPLHVASPAGELRRAGHDVRALDLAVEPWEPAMVEWAEAVAFSVPMHTAMRLALQAAQTVRATRPELPICLYGLYAPVGQARSLGAVADRLIAGEYEPALLAWVERVEGQPAADSNATIVHLQRGRFGLPARDLLPPLERYARLVLGGEERLAGYVEASHGCAHRCRHCPVPTVYDGRTRVVGEDAVLADVQQQVALGARHLTFGDPDFFNGAQHARRVVAAVHHAFPDLTFDCTVKVEHVLAHADLWPEMAAAGCLFVVSAFESVDDTILRYLDKGHTVAEASAAVRLLREHAIEVRPSWLPFTPWTTRAGVADLLAFVGAHDLVANVDPVQYTVRLLLPDGSLLLGLPELAAHLGPYDPERLSWTWTAADPAADVLQAALAVEVEAGVVEEASIETIFGRVAALVGSSPAPGWGVASSGPRPAAERPRLTESWFCCSEPTSAQLAPLDVTPAQAAASTPAVTPAPAAASLSAG